MADGEDDVDSWQAARMKSFCRHPLQECCDLLHLCGRVDAPHRLLCWSPDSCCCFSRHCVRSFILGILNRHAAKQSLGVMAGQRVSTCMLDFWIAGLLSRVCDSRYGFAGVLGWLYSFLYVSGGAGDLAKGGAETLSALTRVAPKVDCRSCRPWQTSRWLVISEMGGQNFG